MAVPTEVPGLIGNEFLGAGCGAPAPVLRANSQPTVPNAGYALEIEGRPFSAVLMAISFAGQNQILAPGCTQFVDTAQVGATVFALTSLSGDFSQALPIPPGLQPIDLWCQAAQIVQSGPVLGQFELSNGLRIRIGGSACP